MDDMKESIGDETFDMINEQLGGMGRKGMETQRTENRDGSEEAIMAKANPFAIDRTAVTVDEFRLFVKDTGFITEAEKFQWSFVHQMLLSKAVRGLQRPALQRLARRPARRPARPAHAVLSRSKHLPQHPLWNPCTRHRHSRRPHAPSPPPTPHTPAHVRA